MCFQISQNEKTPFQAIKPKNTKSGKIAIFPKGLVHGFPQKLTIFRSFFFKAIQAGKEGFSIFYNKKTCFLATKQEVQKVEKLPFFHRGYCTVLVKNWRFFHLFFLGKIGQENVFYDILQRKNVFLSYKNKKFKKSKNCNFSKWFSPQFWSKIRHFSIFSFQAVKARKMSFTILQNQKTPFQAIKTRSSKRGKIAIFPKWLVHGFGQKLAIFPSFFLLKVIQARKICFTIFQNKKTPFQAIKTRSSKSGKIAIFPKGLVHGFGQKLAIFPSFFLLKVIQARKICFTIFQNKKTPFQAIKTRSSKSGKIAIFPKGLVHAFGQKLASFLSFFFLR